MLSGKCWSRLMAATALSCALGVGAVAEADDAKRVDVPAGEDKAGEQAEGQRGSQKENVGAHLYTRAQQQGRPAGLTERRAALRAFSDKSDAEALRVVLNEARALVDDGEVDQALGRYTHLMKVTGEGWLMIEVGATLTWYGRYSEALIHLEEGLRREPLSFQGILSVAVTRDALGQTAEAMRLYKRALMIRPDSYDARFNLGRLQYALGQLEEAERTYRDLLGRHGGDWKSLNNLGLILLERGQPTAAMSPLRRALKLKPKDPGALYNLGRAYTARDEHTRALSYYDRALEEWGADDVAAVSLHFARGNALFALRRYKESAAAYALAHELDPESSDVLLNLGAALANQGRYEEAIQALESAVEHTARPTRVVHQIALCYMYDDKLDAALKALERARALDGADPMTWVLMSQVHDARGDQEASASALAEACRLGSKRSCR
ncbi:MAG: hypothetical protein CMH57_02135 [Myxococcales bacterium]|nr:hypothetical protein [Myxococcales bacterium]